MLPVSPSPGRSSVCMAPATNDSRHTSQRPRGTNRRHRGHTEAGRRRGILFPMWCRFNWWRVKKSRSSPGSKFGGDLGALGSGQQIINFQILQFKVQISVLRFVFPITYRAWRESQLAPQEGYAIVSALETVSINQGALPRLAQGRGLG